MKQEASGAAADAVEQRLDAALDQALARALQAPALPPSFRNRLDAALVRATAEAAGARARLERERRERQAELDAGYLRIRRETLGMLIGGAFVAGAAIMLLVPWFNATFGTNAAFAISVSGALAGLAIAALAWMRRAGVSNPLDLLR